ncbi:MAG: AAA family ATPase [Gemmataceae bacterium]
MIRTIKIENYKSITDLTLEVGRVTVLIGANGSGKSNLLEAVALASAAAQDKLDNEFLATRGVRVGDMRFMRPAFGGATESHDTHLTVEGDLGVDVGFYLVPAPPMSSSHWWPRRVFSQTSAALRLIKSLSQSSDVSDTLLRLSESLLAESGTLPGFLIYAPENSALRTFQAEGQILPLGIRGEGLFAHLKGLNTDAHRDRLRMLREKLTLIDWFESFDIPEDLAPGERSLRIRDRFLPADASFDQRIANEGFLFLLFYFTLFISPETPAFFSIDNVDSALNPKMCSVLLRELVSLAKEHGKQVIFTTHNPAVLDGLDLQDDEQRLFVVDRTKGGHTRVSRVQPPERRGGQPPVNLSEAFLRGYLGGIPTNF